MSKQQTQNFRGHKVKRRSLAVFLAIIQILFLSMATSRAASQEIQKITPEENLTDSIRHLSESIALRDIFSIPKDQAEDTFFFFIPTSADDKDQSIYIYDKDLNRMLYFPNYGDLSRQFKAKKMTEKDWTSFLNQLILNEEKETRQIDCQSPTQLSIIEISDGWIEFSLDGRHIILPQELMLETAVYWQEERWNLPLGQEIVDRETALAQDYTPDDLVQISQKWNYHTEDYPKYLREYVVAKLEQMLRNAEEQGIHIRVFSAYRSYKTQRYLYLQALYSSGKNQKGVAAPGHSEHQLGTTVDLCGLDPETVLSPYFDLTKEGHWLSENSQKFGFHQSYTQENRQETGYIPEPWHFRYLGVERILPHPGAVPAVRILGTVPDFQY
jgi:LAS superfamily LD-carboxypeptidase LdcB